MSWNHRRIGAVAVVLVLACAPAQAQPWYGGGYWGYGGYGGGQTVQGSVLQGEAAYAMGLGRYNVETAQARSINADTAMRWNQYVYESHVEAERVWAQEEARKQSKEKGNYKAIQDRVRKAPNALDIQKGNALNAAVNDLSDPKLFKRALYYGGKVKVGGEDIRDIPFQYAAAAISISVHQLTQGGAPEVLKRDMFAPDRANLKGIADELRTEGVELGTHKPETIKKAKDQIMATKAKVEATFPKTSKDYQDAEKYIKALYGLASMLETPAVNVLLAGAEKRPEATLGDLLHFMAVYNLRFGPAETPRQREIYSELYPVLAKLRDDVIANVGPNPPASAVAGHAVPGEVFEGIGYNSTERTPPPPPKPQ